MPRCRCKPDDHEVHKPANTYADRAADAVQRNLLTQQSFHHHRIFFINHPLGGVHNKLTTTVLALVILLAIMNVTILLDLPRPPFRACVSHARGHLWSSTRCQCEILAIHTTTARAEQYSYNTSLSHSSLRVHQSPGLCLSSPQADAPSQPQPRMALRGRRAQLTFTL